MNLNVFTDVINSGNSSAVVHYARGMSISRVGSLVTQPISYYHASGTTTGVNLKTGAGNLHAITINNATNNAVITLADSITGATPAIFVHTAGATSTSAYSIPMYGLPFFNGLRLIVSAANASVTIVYE